MKMRDIISHHYEGLDHEIIFSICKDKLKDLKFSVIEILNKLNSA
ncbi:putative toxin-antitoxin system, antitoxin component [Leptospira alstonii serovar Pingchang str. 80-412]|uniref:Toxin-antitoxin system, antitoxin component n=2 Tax=Leptospira alstonii TaxID=28452 RepID=T0G7A2_9LEPT|nr:putative toxin-antitoxin system, antitoxin component [Leptospira alstonii serovar Pingchang str. 80-412]